MRVVVRRIAMRAPQRQLSACRMAHDDHTLRVDRNTIGGKRRQVIDSRNDVVERPWPSPSWRPNPAISEIPDGEATRCEVACNRVHLVASMRHAPEATMQQADNGGTPRVVATHLRQMQVACLVRTGAVSDRLHGRLLVSCCAGHSRRVHGRRHAYVRFNRNAGLRGHQLRMAVLDQALQLHVAIG